MVKLTNVPGQLSSGKDVFPAVILNNNNLTTVAECEDWIKQNQQQLEKQLLNSGAILFRGFPVDSAEAFDRFSASFGYPNFTYKDSLSNAVRINFTERVFTANEAPKDVEIYLHNEMAQTPVYPDNIFFFCLTPADNGGASPLCRCDMLYNGLVNSMPELAKDFANKGVKYTTIMPDVDNPQSGQGRSWMSTLSIKTKEEAETKLSRLGYSWQWLDDGSLKATTGVLPAVRRLNCGRDVFFNQIIAAFMGWKGVKENPDIALTFGDGSSIPIDGLKHIAQLAEEYVYDAQWQAGDVAMVDNNLAMHGRRPYSGDTKRQVLVALGAAKENVINT